MEYSKSQDLKQVYLFNNKAALNGKKVIDSFLNKNDVKGMTTMLRHHDEKTISDAETWKRDDIDYFLDYFSLITLARITGYLNHFEFESFRVDIAYYLGNGALKRFYYY